MNDSTDIPTNIPPSKLSDEQKKLILTKWNQNPNNPPAITDLVKLVWPDIDKKLQDGRSLQGRLVKQYLVEHDLKYDKFRPTIELTSSQKEYITNNVATMTAFEMSKQLFNNPSIGANSHEANSVKEYIKDNIPKEALFDKDENLEDSRYRPPKTIAAAINKIERYVKDCKIEKEKLAPTHKKMCESLISYLHDYRLIHQLNTYTDTKERELFESSLISYTWDKPDLTAEDVHQYIILCTEVVMSSNIQKTINLLQAEQDKQLDQNDGKLSMAIIEAVSVSRQEYNGSVKRQEALIKSLTQERSKRLSEKISQNTSVLNIVEAWKQKISRDEMIQMAQNRKQKLSNEIDRIENMDELKSKYLGLSREEILEG